MFYFILALTVLLTDLLLKKKIDETPVSYFPHPLKHNYVALEKFHNPGVMLGFLKEKRSLARLLSLSITLLSGAMAVSAFVFKTSALLKTAFSLILGGAFSNGWDRARKGYVVDYIRFPQAPAKLKNIIFNLGDFSIFAGIALMLLHEITSPDL